MLQKVHAVCMVCKYSEGVRRGIGTLEWFQNLNYMALSIKKTNLKPQKELKDVPPISAYRVCKDNIKLALLKVPD